MYVFAIDSSLKGLMGNDLVAGDNYCFVYTGVFIFSISIRESGRVL